MIDRHHSRYCPVPAQQHEHGTAASSTLELGGSDPFVVPEDANLTMAIKWGVWSRLLNCG
jgi:acyl-CoA reductase-like NAD-dependent aldehyde dehydrogenase